MDELEKLKTKRDDLQAKRDAAEAKIAAILGGDDLTDDQVAEVERLEGESKALAKQLALVNKSYDRSVESAREKELATAADDRADRLRVPGTYRKTTPDAPVDPAKPKEHKDAQGRVTGFFEDTDEVVNLRFGDVPEARNRQSYKQSCRQNQRLLKASGYEPWGEFTSFSDFVRVGLNGHQNSDFRDRVGRHYAAIAGMSEGVGADGGYTLMPEFAPGILDRVYANDLWGRTDNYTVTGNNMTFLANAETSRATGSRAGGLRGYWLAEGASITSSKPTLREISLKLVKLGVVVYLTDELIADTGYALQQYVQKKAAEEFNFMIGDSLINGTGVGQPLGILNFPSLVSIAKETGQAAASLQSENIVKMYARFYAPYLGNMVWLHNQDIAPQLYLLTLGIGAAGIATYMPPGGLSGSPYANLMGRPMIPTEFNATLGTQGDLIASDMSQILSISKGGVAQAVSMHVQFLTDQMALRFIMRLNAGPWWNAPLTPYKGPSNTQADNVVLDSRT